MQWNAIKFNNLFLAQSAKTVICDPIFQNYSAWQHIVCQEHIRNTFFLCANITSYEEMYHYSGELTWLTSFCISFSQFLGMFAKLWKATISFIMSVRPYGIIRLPLDGFSWNMILEYLSKIFWENSSFIKIWQE